MTLYTIMPPHLIYPTETFLIEEVVFNGVRMTVRKNEKNSYEVVQIVSTNPNDYLSFYPGQEIM